MIHTLLYIFIVLCIVGLILWGIQQIPGIPGIVKTVLYVIIGVILAVAVVLLLWPFTLIYELILRGARDAAVVQQPFRHFATQAALDQRHRFIRLQIVEVGPFLPADFQEVAKPVAGDQTG